MNRLLIFIMLFPIVTFANNQILFYEPKIVTVTGVIKTLRFPGPPNYSSIKEGDLDETGSYLLLEKPIDVEMDPQTNNEQTEKNVVLLQLVVTNNQHRDKIKEGNKVHITGTLFHALTGHHHARILFKINNIRLIKYDPQQDHSLRLTREDRLFLKKQHLQ